MKIKMPAPSPNDSYSGPIGPVIMIQLETVDKAYIVISNIFAVLSICGCLVTVSCYLVLSGIRTTSRFLLVFLGIANFLSSVSTMFQSMTYYRTIKFPNENSFICTASAGLFVFSQICTALWTTAITFYLFLCVTCRLITVANRLTPLFHVFCWTMPVIVALCADYSGVYGYDLSDILTYKHPTECWLSDRVSNALAWYLLTVEGWVMAAYLICSILYLPILWSTIRNKTKGKEVMGDDVIEDLGILTANEQLRFIPVIYVCTRIWGTMYFLFTRYPEERHLRGNDWLEIIKGIGDNSQGLVNAIFFCLATKQIRKTLALKICRYFACCCSACGEHRVIGGERWMRVPQIIRTRPKRSSKRSLDGSDLDISGISLDLPESTTEEVVHHDEDEVLFER